MNTFPGARRWRIVVVGAVALRGALPAGGARAQSPWRVVRAATTIDLARAEAVPAEPYDAAGRAVAEGVRACLGAGPEPAELDCLRGLAEDARAAIDIRPDGAEGHYWLAVTLGLQVEFLGGRDKVAAASEVYREARRTLELDAGHAGAHHVLGRLEAGVMRMGRLSRFLATSLLGGDALGEASWEEAEALLRFAEEHEPWVPEHHCELAALLHDRGRTEEVRVEAKHVLALPRQPGDARVREQAAELLEKM